VEPLLDLIEEGAIVSPEMLIALDGRRLVAAPAFRSS
jgi:hypothetical protein